MITKWIQFRVAPESAEVFCAALARVEVASLAEDGCGQYLAFRSEEEPTVFTVLESWETAEAFDAHRTSAHVAAFKNECGEMIVEKSGLGLRPLAG